LVKPSCPSIGMYSLLNSEDLVIISSAYTMVHEFFLDLTCLTQDKTHGFPSSVRYAPTPTLNFPGLGSFLNAALRPKIGSAGASGTCAKHEVTDIKLKFFKSSCEFSKPPFFFKKALFRVGQSFKGKQKIQKCFDLRFLRHLGRNPLLFLKKNPHRLCFYRKVREFLAPDIFHPHPLTFW
jgi:hypothetical protein